MHHSFLILSLLAILVPIKAQTTVSPASIRPVGNQTQCLTPNGHKLTLNPCGPENKIWTLTLDVQRVISNADGQCITNDDSPNLVPCTQSGDITQEWIFFDRGRVLSGSDANQQSCLTALDNKVEVAECPTELSVPPDDPSNWMYYL